MILTPDFYCQKEVLLIARQLLGKVLCTRLNGVLTSGFITETEAYAGTTDKACHAFGGRRTTRNETMYGLGGHAYVYLCYGMHHLFNVVTHQKEQPFAVLIRAVHPLDGLQVMLQRRKHCSLKPNLSAGPGAMSQALGIHKIHNGLALQGPEIWIEDRGINIAAKDIQLSPRIGVAYAQEHALLPYRFYIKEDPFVSKTKPLNIAQKKRP